MARFSRKDIFFKDNDMAVFGTDQDSRLYWDDSKNELTLTSTISGVDPTQGYHLATKDYVDTTITGVVSGDYVKRDGTTTLTDDWDVGDGKYILTDFLKARDDGGIFLYTYNESAHLHLEDHAAVFSTTSGVSISAESVSIDLGTNPQTDINLVSKYEAVTDKSNIRVSSEITALSGTLVEFYGIATQVDVVTTSSGDVEYVSPFQTQTTNFGAGNIENFFGGYYNIISNGEGNIASLNGTYISTTADGWDYESEEQISSPGVIAAMNGIKMTTTICCGAPVGNVGGIAIDQPEIYGGGYATNAIGLYIEDWTVQSGGYGLNIASMGGLNMFAGPVVVGGVQTFPIYTFQVMNDAGTSYDIAVTQSGNVGFGVASPNYKVHVDGSIYSSKNFRAVDGSITAVGYEAGDGSIAEPDLTAVGYQAAINCSGTSVVAVGRSAAINNSGNYVAAMGYLSAQNNTGERVFAVGNYALSNNTADFAVGVGELAGQNNAGNNAIFVGYNAGNGNSGNATIGIGNYAGMSNDTPSNVFIGAMSGFNVSGMSSGYTTAIGANSAQFNQGDYCLGLGYQSLMSNQGNNVVALGYQAGQSNTLNDKLIIKHNSSNATSLIYGDFATGQVSIATEDLPNNVALNVNGIAIASTPVSGTHLATKQYVDDAVGSGVYWTKTGSTLHPTNVNNNVSIGTTITGTASLNVYEQVYLHEFTGGTTQLVLDNSMTAEGGESYISFKDDGDIVGVFRAGSSELEFTAYSNQNRDMIVQTGNDSDGTNDTYLRTGDASGGDSGNVYISTGTAGGTKGSVYVQSDLDVSSNKIINLNTPTTYSGAANKGYVDNQLSSISGSDVTLNHLDGSTYSTAQDFVNTIQSAGALTDVTVTDNGDGSISVGAGTGIIKSTDSDVGANYFFNWDADPNVVLASGVTNWVYVDYNGGSPVITSTGDLANVDLHTQVILCRAFIHTHDSQEVHIMKAGQYFQDFQARTCYRDFEVYRVQRASGEVISETGTRNLSVTAGVLYCSHTRFTTPDFDSSGDDRFFYWYRDGAGGWTMVSGVAQIDNQNYDDGTGTLAALLNNNYGNHWVYRTHGGEVHVQYGQDGYNKLSDAEDASVPNPPTFLRDFALLIGRVIIEEDGTSFTDVSSIFETRLQHLAAAIHNDLGELQGGTADQYYHLTSAQHSSLTSTGGVSDASTEHTHDGRYYTESEVDTISGSLQVQINNVEDTPYCHVKKAQNQSIASGTEAAVLFDSSDTEVSDTSGMHSPTTNNTRFTIPTGEGGLYLAQGWLCFDDNSSGVRQCWFRINGDTTGDNAYQSVCEKPNSIGVSYVSASVIIDLSAGDYLEFFAYQSSGGSLDLLDDTTDDDWNKTEVKIKKLD